MPNNTEGEAKERKIKDMLGLVKFCLQTTASEDAPASDNPHVGPLDPDRRAWLEQAIASMTVDTTRQLLENLAIVKDTVAQLQKDQNHDISIQKTCDAISILTDLCEEIDYAADFAKLDGFSIFKTLINSQHEELIVKACELIAALGQNNPICQTAAMSTKLLERLIDFVDMKDDLKYIKARSYALYAISSIVRSNPEVRAHFESTLDGLTVLSHLMDCHQLDLILDPKVTGEEAKTSSIYWWRKLRIRSVFLFQTLCLESENASKFFYDKGAIKQLGEQLKNCQDFELREHLLLALKAFVQSIDAAKQKESREQLNDIRDIVKEIYDSSSKQSSDDFDMTDTRSVCEELTSLIQTFQKN